MSNERPVKRRRLQAPVKSENFIYKYIQNTRFLATPDAPLIFSSYFKIIYHALGITIILFILFKCVQTFINDIQEHYDFQMEELLQKARVCHQKYTEHECRPDMKGETWRQICEEWDNCRNFPSYGVSKSKITAQVFGELTNGFVEPLSIKSMIVIALLVSGFFIISTI